MYDRAPSVSVYETEQRAWQIPLYSLGQYSGEHTKTVAQRRMESFKINKQKTTNSCLFVWWVFWVLAIEESRVSQPVCLNQPFPHQMSRHKFPRNSAVIFITLIKSASAPFSVGEIAKCLRIWGTFKGNREVYMHTTILQLLNVGQVQWIVLFGDHIFFVNRSKKYVN